MNFLKQFSFSNVKFCCFSSKCIFYDILVLMIYTIHNCFHFFLIHLYSILKIIIDDNFFHWSSIFSIKDKDFVWVFFWVLIFWRMVAFNNLYFLWFFCLKHCLVLKNGYKMVVFLLFSWVISGVFCFVPFSVIIIFIILEIEQIITYL